MAEKETAIIEDEAATTEDEAATTENETSVIENESTLIEDEIDYKYTEENGNSDLIKMIKALNPNKKWKLSTGKYVEDELFIFGLQCQEDHPSKYLILDPGDLSYVEYGVFTNEELDEILTFEEKKPPFPPLHILKHMDEYNLNTAADIRLALKKNHTIEVNPDKDIDWINYTVYSLLREYESENMKKHHSEIWYQTHIWRMIEVLYFHSQFTGYLKLRPLFCPEN